ncbi:HAD hydrolase family protein [uncultured Polaribacter sp.]|uniref:KdsC family phosphatase n=1 Tax=uncultured Polaribacter sp. TaxID=174711 RepID=UPI00263615FF|nr:HAD hydrolase family protein [uncultured Polaribacter sp.]
MNKLPKLVITDIDGVWTDGGMFYDNHHGEWKKFNTADSVGVLYLKLLNIPIAIITGEDTQIVKRRAEKLKIEYTYLGISDKVKLAKDLIENLNITFEDVAFIGDEINDLELLKKVGFSAAPKNASDLVKSIVDLNLEIAGGNGAFRDFILKILGRCGLQEIDLYNMYLENKNLNQ